jgi:hypothetical protein
MNRQKAPAPLKTPCGARTLACCIDTHVDVRRDEQRTVPVGNVSSGRNFGAAAPVFPRACAEVSGESRRSTQECVRHRSRSSPLEGQQALGTGAFSTRRRH